MCFDMILLTINLSYIKILKRKNMQNPKFQIFKGKDDQFYFRFKAANGEIIFSSDGYTTKQSAKHTIEVIQQTVNGVPTEDLTLDI